MTHRRGARLPAFGVLGLAAGLAALLTGCGDYDPPVAANHEAPAYQADLTACQTTADTEADRRAKATFPMFVIYPVAVPYEQRVLISRCMAAKGYKDRG